MRNAKLDAALVVLRKAEESVSRSTLLDLIEAIGSAPGVEYEVDDFIQYNEGMGEAGFGVITACESDRCQVETWTPDAVKYPSYQTTVMIGDITGISNVNAAFLYHKIRSGT